MRKILAVAQREFAAMVATKTFLFTLIMMPILMFGAILAMPYLNKLGGGKERKIVIADASGKLFEAIQSASEQRNTILKAVAEQTESESDTDDEKMSDPFEQTDRFVIESAESATLSDEQRLALSDRIRAGDLYAFVEIPADIAQLNPGADATIDFVSQDAAISSARQWLSSILQIELRNSRLDELGVNKSLVKQADLPLVIEPTSPYKEQKDGSITSSQGADTFVTIFLPFGVMMLMFMVIMLAAQPMLESGMEEKSQRISELLLGSVTPTQLMVGKLAGNICGSLTIFALYGIGAYFSIDPSMIGDQLSWDIMPWFLTFQILGVLFYSSIFLTVGASISDLKEAQSLLLPVWMLIMLPMMVWFVVIRDPNGIVPVSLSFFPPSASMMMILRLATGQTIPAWQPPVAALGLTLATIGVVVVAGRLYRISLLRTDPVRSIMQLFKRLRHA